MIRIISFLSQHLYWILGLSGVSLAFWKAWTLRWLCDDAFFSFIYSRNLLEGKGFVFNSGEKIEAITNALWALLLALFQWGLPFLTFGEISIYLGLTFYLALIVSALFLEKRFFSSSTLPIFTLSLASFYHLSVFATSGLETIAFTCFVFWGIILEPKKESFLSSASPILHALSGFLRPEGFLFYFFSLIEKKDKLNKISISTSIIIILLGLGIRFIYFESLVPNTFYAKSGFFPEEGILYFLQIFKSYPMLFFPLGLVIFSFREWKWEFLGILIFISYVIVIGGDFMVQRFWIPVLPILFWKGYALMKGYLDSLQIQSNRNSKWAIFLSQNTSICYLVFLTSFAIYRPFDWKTNKNLSNLRFVEERDIYKAELLDMRTYELNGLAGLRIAFFGAQAHFVFAMRPDFALEAESGLTNSYLGKKPNTEKGRAGHRKPVSFEELSRFNLDLLLDDRFPEISLPIVTHFWRGQALKFKVINSEKIRGTVCHRKDWDCSLLYKK